jgi:uncharacterized protein (DUF2141 family)
MNVAQITRMLAMVFVVGCVACTPDVEPLPAPETVPNAAPKPASEAASVDTAEASTDAATITVNITKLRNSDGMVQITLYDNEDEYLTTDSETARIVRVDIEDDKATCVFAGVKPGKYAVALMHDEDNDGEMKKSLIGIPKEGIGMSNNAKLTFGPPKWEDAVFDVGDEDVSLEIALMYI